MLIMHYGQDDFATGIQLMTPCCCNFMAAALQVRTLLLLSIKSVYVFWELAYLHGVQKCTVQTIVYRASNALP